MMERLLVVLAHGNAKETVLRHLPIWKAITPNIIINSPREDPLSIEGVSCLVMGQSARYDAKTNIRTRRLLGYALKIEAKHTIFCEYDALLWRWPSLTPLSDEVMASKFMSADSKFLGRFYLHSPIIFGRRALEQTFQTMLTLADDAEGGFGDRYFGLAVERAGLEVIDGHALGLSYSQNHITGAFVDQCADAVKNGACFTHGVKEHSVLTRILTRAKIAY